MALSKSPPPGVKALKRDLERMDRARDLALCATFLQRGINRWRNPNNDYSCITDGLVKALRDELRDMAKETSI